MLILAVGREDRVSPSRGKNCGAFCDSSSLNWAGELRRGRSVMCIDGDERSRFGDLGFGSGNFIVAFVRGDGGPMEMAGLERGMEGLFLPGEFTLSPISRADDRPLTPLSSVWSTCRWSFRAGRNKICVIPRRCTFSR